MHFHSSPVFQVCLLSSPVPDPRFFFGVSDPHKWISWKLYKMQASQTVFHRLKLRKMITFMLATVAFAGHLEKRDKESADPRCINGNCAIITDLKVDSKLPDTYTGTRFNQVMSAFVPNVRGAAVEGDNLNEGVTDSSFAGIYAQYQIFDRNSTSQTIITDAVIAESCPQGYISTGQITKAPKKSLKRTLKNFFGVRQDKANCKNLHLCIQKVPVSTLRITDTIATSLAISKNAGGDLWIPGKAESEASLTWLRDSSNIHQGEKCGDSFTYYLVLERDAAFPRDSATFSDLEKKNMIWEYAPLIVNHPKEKYHPSSISYFLNGTERVYDEGNKFWYLSSKTKYNSDLQTFNEQFWKGNSNLDKVPVYAYYAQRSPAVVDVIYSAVYPFNYGKKVLIWTFGHHVGDMEHVAVRFVNGAPAHFGIQTHGIYDQLYFNSPKLVKVGSQTKVWQALGSHGMWIHPGNNVYLEKSIKPLKGLKISILKLTDACADGPIWDARNRAFDIKAQKFLPGKIEFKIWPKILSNNGYNNATIGYSDSRSGPVHTWGNIWKVIFVFLKSESAKWLRGQTGHHLKLGNLLD